MAELLPIATVLELLGLDDDTDGKIEAQLAVVTELFEHACQRGLAYVADVEEEMPLSGRLGLFRYPVDAVSDLTVDEQAVLTPYRVDKAHGIVLMDGWYYGYYSQRARVLYSGGYPPDEVPADLALAFARCSADSAGVTYASAGAGGGGAPLKALGLGSGALTVQFDTGTAAAASAYDASSLPALLQPYHFVLDHYRMKDFV